MQNRVRAAVGSSTVPWRARSTGTPLACARKSSRRVAVRSSARCRPWISPQTAANAGQLAPSSSTQSASSRRCGKTAMTLCASRPKRTSPGPWTTPASRVASGAATHNTGPGRKFAIRFKSAMTNPLTAPESRLCIPTTSCRLASLRLPSANNRSSSGTPKANLCIRSSFVLSFCRPAPSVPSSFGVCTAGEPAGPSFLAGKAGAGPNCVLEGRRPSSSATRRRSSARLFRDRVCPSEPRSRSLVRIVRPGGFGAAARSTVAPIHWVCSLFFICSYRFRSQA